MLRIGLWKGRLLKVRRFLCLRLWMDPSRLLIRRLLVSVRRRVTLSVLECVCTIRRVYCRSLLKCFGIML